MITAEENQPVVAQIVGWLRKLVPTPTDGDQLVWHYTRGESLIKMVETASIFSTQASCLNDSTEILYASKILRLALEQLLPSLAKGSAEESFIQRYIEALAEGQDSQGNASNMFFVSCFSELEDDLSLWRAYAGGENGYAIGFPKRFLGGGTNCLAGPVNYDPLIHQELAAEVAKSTVENYLAFRGRRSAEQLGTFDDEFMNYWDEHLQGLAPFVKDPGFASEHEFRIAHPYSHPELGQIVILQRRTMMSRHIPLTSPAVFREGTEHLPFTKVLVGPGRHKQVSLVSLKTLLLKHGYTWVEVEKSLRPYQET